MTKRVQPARIHFNASGMPVADEFDDIYYSNDNGAEESRYVFMQHNGLPGRFHRLPPHRPFVIAETGFGTGLNVLLAVADFVATAPSSARLHVVSFERFPLRADDLRQALQHWPQLRDLAAQLLDQYPPLIAGCHRLYLADGRVRLDLHFADVLEALPAWSRLHTNQVNAWFLDGFAPSKNPQMWQPALYQAMALSAAADCTLATFTATGHVRRGLQDAGFSMRKTRGYGKKRDMLCGHKLQPAPAASRRRRRIAVVGGGIAAACVAERLSRENTQVDIFCADDQLATGASGNAQGAIYPLLQADFTPATELYTQAFVFATHYYQQLPEDAFCPSGVIQLAFSEQVQRRQQKIIDRTDYPPEFMRVVDQDEASSLAGIPVDNGGFYFPKAGWAKPEQLVESLVSASAAQVYVNSRVDRIEHTHAGWQLMCNGNAHTYDDVVLACGEAVSEFDNGLLDIRPVAGQVSYLNAASPLSDLRVVLCHKGYLTPQHKGVQCVGASYRKGQISHQNQRQDDEHNLGLLQTHVKVTQEQPLHLTGARTRVRATTADHLPVVGAMPLQPPGLWVLSGLGSRGLTSAPWCAELLASQLYNEVQPTTEKLSAALQPRRFYQRQQVRQQNQS
ncbi:bifunctional tRNA (5-methylaminomethyl-2-thiouridine)(34)-methyltransferase MnmD/FAD-dependent 5-carboxymethylaminomethyl-2-thiouridine(34) oxidoreductase MnmC [Aliidiomarina sp. Khilg15.8]